MFGGTREREKERKTQRKSDKPLLGEINLMKPWSLRHEEEIKKYFIFGEWQ